MNRLGTMPALRYWLLSVIALNLAMIGIRLYLDPQILGLPGGLPAALEPAAMLILIAFLVVWATRWEDPAAWTILARGPCSVWSAGRSRSGISRSRITGGSVRGSNP